MSTMEVISKIQAIKEWMSMQEEAAAMVESLRDEIKAIMTDMGVEELVAGEHIVRYTTVLSNRFDSTAFKKVMPDMYKAYTKQITSRRFTISG